MLRQLLGWLRRWAGQVYEGVSIRDCPKQKRGSPKFEQQRGRVNLFLNPKLSMLAPPLPPAEQNRTPPELSWTTKISPEVEHVVEQQKLHDFFYKKLLFWDTCKLLGAPVVCHRLFNHYIYRILSCFLVRFVSIWIHSVFTQTLMFGRYWKCPI